MQNSKVRLTLYFILMIAVMIAIFCFSSQDGEESSHLSGALSDTVFGRLLERVLPRLFSNDFSLDIRKYAHMFEYLCLGLSACLFTQELFYRKIPLFAPIAELICVLYAASDEWHQTFVPGRTGRIFDILVDSYGFTAGVLIVTLIVTILLIKRKGCE